MELYLLIIILILVVLLIHSYSGNSAVLSEKEQLICVRETALEIANRVVNTNDPADLYQYILDSCLKLIPKAKYGSILMFNPDGLLTARASVGFNSDGISNFKLKLEESFLYIATGGKLDHTVIINRLEDIVQPKNIVTSGDQGSAIRSEVSAPLHINGELVGLLCVDGDTNDIFSEQDSFILDYMSNQISIVINNQKLYREILYLSRYDSLTHFLNRDSFERETTELLNDPSKDAANLYFVLMDLDDLKAVNDTFGHHFGDETIINFSDIIRNHLGKNDICGRYGGDEFAAAIQGDNMCVNHILEESKKEFMELKNKDQAGAFTPSFSYGKASFEEGHCSLDALYKLADSRMYATKKKH
ncbi:MAG TPA: sensor domain-containing diguanylate cyclase [Anaerovoracaceae bacterium]|nr:sensor domain-containing diguanylate cyclase [Anaerovoracaceae bacterium]